MITFEGRQKTIQTAYTIGLKAHNIYPHVSSSQVKKRYFKANNISEFSQKPLPEFYNKISEKVIELREILKNNNSKICDFIYAMQDKKVGNCFEEALLAEIIGKLNGQKNIYVGNIFVKKENVPEKKSIDHSVAFITNKRIKSKKEYEFKNKEAIIIDPWLGITDFASNYFTQLKNHFKNSFKELPDQDFLEYLIGTESKNIKEFRDGRRNSCQDLKFNIESVETFPIDKLKQKIYKAFFPELVIKKYKKIELPKLTNQKSIAKKESL